MTSSTDLAQRVRELCARAQRIRDFYAMLERVPGSGHHENDRNPTQPALFMAPSRNGLCPASQNLVAFSSRTGNLFVGADAARVWQMLAAARDRIKAKNPIEMDDHDQHLLAAVPDLEVVSNDQVRLDLGEWNCYLTEFHRAGVGVFVVPLNDESSDPRC